MSQSYFMGIDTGTNSSKGVLMSDKGEVVAVETAAHSMKNPKPGYYEHDADNDWWGDFCKISHKLLNKTNISSTEVKGVGISALGADCLPVDKDCNPLRMAILYGIDARASAEIDELTNYFGEDQILKWFGRPLGSSDIMPKILWIKNNEPEIWKRTYKFLTGSSFITAKLTGNFVVDRFLGLASFNPLYDQTTWKPVPELDKVVCRPDQLAEVKEATDIAGYVTEEAANDTGLAVGTPVTVGTDDSGAEAISTGVVEAGKMMIQLGSSVYMILGTPKLVDDKRLWREQFIVPGLCDISAGTNTAGSGTKWYRDNIFSELMQNNDHNRKDPYAVMAQLIKEVPAGSHGLLTLPYFAGERTPINDPRAKGLIIGITLDNTRADLYKSLLEGICLSISQQISIMESHPEVNINQIFATGGGVQNEEWVQILADVTGKSISTPAVTVGASFGDAMMSAVGVGFPGFENFSALTKYIKPGRVYHPDSANHDVYVRLQDLYDSLYDTNVDAMHSLDI